MGETTGIGWTDHTASPWWGCLKVSPGCEHCYAETLAVTRRKLPAWGPPSTTERKRTKGAWKDVLRWNRATKKDGVRRRMFVSSLSDIFEAHPMVAPWRAEALDLLAQCDGLDVQLLTKRPENIRAMVPAAWLESWPAHVWVGTTAEDQRRANERIPHLLRVPAAVRFLSCEPLLEAVDLTRLPAELLLMDALRGDRFSSTGGGKFYARGEAIISWAIVGGESGPGARPFDLAWARSIVRQCDDAGVPVFVKQMGDNPVDSALVDIYGPDGKRRYTRPADHYDVAEARATRGYDVLPHALKFKAHHAADPSEWPADLQRQEFPNGGAR